MEIYFFIQTIVLVFFLILLKITIRLHNENLKLIDIISTKDQFFVIIAHDLKNPFRVLTGFSSLLIQKRNEYSSEKKLYMIESILSVSKNTYNLLENLLIWSKTQTKSIIFTPNKYDIIDVINNIKFVLDISLQEKKIDLLVYHHTIHAKN